MMEKKSSHNIYAYSVQFSSIAQSCPTLCDPMNHSTPGLPVHHQLLEFTQTHAHRVGDAIQPSHPLSSPSPPAPNDSQHQGLFQRINSLHIRSPQCIVLNILWFCFQWSRKKGKNGMCNNWCILSLCLSFNWLLDELHIYDVILDYFKLSIKLLTIEFIIHGLYL